MNTAAKYTFEQFEKDLDTDLPLTSVVDLLNAQQKADLIEAVGNFGEKELECAHDTTRCCFGMEVPDEMLRAIFKENLELAYESYFGSLLDTFPRETFCDAITTYMGLPTWPTIGDGDIAETKFLVQLKATAPKFGVKLL